MSENATYRKINHGVIEISIPFQEPFRLDRNSLRRAIKNTKKQSHLYHTQAAFDTVLNMYTSALAILNTEEEAVS